MRIPKIIVLNFVFVSFALLHVFLQTEITKLGYETKKNEDKCQELIDNNRVLKYNVYALESPNTLDKYVLLKDSKLKVLKPVQVEGISSQSSPSYLARRVNSAQPDKNSLLLVLKRFVSVKQAEAETKQ
jgi:hypothetical protein